MIRIQCRECGCIRNIKDKEIPKGNCQYCEKDFGYYTCKGLIPPGLEKYFPLQEGDILVIDTTLPAVVGDNEPNFDRIYSLWRNGGCLFSKITYGG
jgi:hypothetical protein